MEIIKIEPDSLGRISKIPGAVFDDYPKDGIAVSLPNGEVGIETQGDTIIYDGHEYYIRKGKKI